MHTTRKKENGVQMGVKNTSHKVTAPKTVYNTNLERLNQMRKFNSKFIKKDDF